MTTTVYSLKHSFNAINTEKTKIANLLNIKFKNLVEFFKIGNYTLDLPKVRQKTPFPLGLLLSLNVWKRFLSWKNQTIGSFYHSLKAGIARRS